MDRTGWVLDDYINELVHIYELEQSMDPEQWKQMYGLFTTEMIAKFPEDIRKERGLLF